MQFTYRHLLYGFGAVLLAMPVTMVRADLYSETLSQIHRGDYTLARNRLITLAKGGHGKAQFQLGLMYHRGKGVPQNYRKAVKWYRAAADASNAGARNNLGVIYRDGLGLPHNDIMAYMWFNLAASEEIGSGLGRKNRDTLSENMSPGDILQAQQLAEEYLDGLTADNQRRLASAKPVIAPAKPVQMPGAAKPMAATTVTPVPAPAVMPEKPVKMAAAPVPPARLIAPRAAPPKMPAPPTKVAMIPLARGHARDVLVRSLPPPSTAAPEIRKPDMKMKKAMADTTPAPVAAPAMKAPAMKTPARAPDLDPVASRRYLVQLGLFRKPTNVRRVNTRLNSLGIGLRVKDVTVRGARYQRLRVGPYDSAEKARTMARRVNSLFRIKSLLIPEIY